MGPKQVEIIEYTKREAIEKLELRIIAKKIIKSEKKFDSFDNALRKRRFKFSFFIIPRKANGTCIHCQTKIYHIPALISCQTYCQSCYKRKVKGDIK